MMQLRTRLFTSIAAIACASAGTALAFQDTDSTGPNEDEDIIVVQGRAQTLYKIGESTTGKLPTAPLDSTQVIQTINAQLIRDQGARDAQDIYRNIAGVSLFSYAGVTARGFRQEEIFFDGLRGDPYVGFNVPQLFNIERVEFLKGPAGMLYGPGAPGGLFNYVTKKPSEEFSASLRGIFGTEARVGGSLEITGALPMEGSAGRLGIFYEDRNTPRELTGSETTIYDGGFSQELGFAKLTLQATHIEQNLDGNRLRGVPVDDDGNFLTSRRWNHNEPTDFLDLVSTNLQARLEGEAGSEVTWDATLRWTDAEQSQEYHEPRALIDLDADGVPDLVGREFRDQFRAEEQLSFGANLIWARDFGDVQNRFLTGVEHFHEDFDGDFKRTRFSNDFVTRFLAGQSLPGDIQPLFLQNPNYGTTDPTQYDRGPSDIRASDQTRSGVYVLNETTVGPFTVVGGVRYDEYEDRNLTSDDPNDDFSDDNVSFRVGGIYKPVENVAFYAQFADSYVPQGASNQNEQPFGPFDPVTGTIVEGGINAELFDDRALLRIAVYDIVRDNLLQATGEISDGGINILAPVGQVTSTGLEVEFIADITPDWVVTASYAYNDARITEVADNIVIRDGVGVPGISNSVGDRFANAPENAFGFWTRYQVPAINTAFAIGGDYVGERLSFNNQIVQDYLTVDASIIWDNGPFQVLFRVDNLFDEEFAESGFLERTGHFPGDPRGAFIEFYREW
ncbi:MAG: TonB-dependent receptor [Pseudomonadota bacterium]